MIFGPVVIGMLPQRSDAQWGTALKIVAPYVFDQVRNIDPRKLGWIAKGMRHTWWFCRYQNGIVTYNNFRSYRTGAEVYNYFTSTGGDCDSFRYNDYGQKVTACYSPEWIQYYAQQWGPVIEIGIAQ